MGKKNRLKRQKAEKQKQEAQWVEFTDPSLPQYRCRYKIRIKDPAQLIRHALKIDPHYRETARLAVAARKARGDKFSSEEEIHLSCFNILRNGYIPLRECEECGVDCIFQKEKPEPSIRIIIYDKHPDFVEVCLTDISKLALTAGLNQNSLRQLLIGVESDSNFGTDQARKETSKKIAQDIEDIVGDTVVAFIRLNGTAYLSSRQLRQLKNTLARELNQNYDLNIQTDRDEEDLTFLGEAIKVISFIRDSSQVIGKYRYRKVASYVQEICAFCMFLPCECQLESFDEQPSVPPPPRKSANAVPANATLTCQEG